MFPVASHHSGPPVVFLFLHLLERVHFCFICLPRAMQCPNAHPDGSRVASVPPAAQGGWRGIQGYDGISKILGNTRFRLDGRLKGPSLWSAYWFLSAEHDGRSIVPIVCQVCGEQPDRITLSNLVSATRSSARCACTSRPKHGTLEGRAKVAVVVEPQGYRVAEPEETWVRAHLRRNENWKFIRLECTACRRARHIVVARGAASYARIGKCACQGSRRTKSGRKQRSQATTATVAAC